jgi:hypothetical protein
MTESSEVRASREEVEAFVGELRRFHSSLDKSGQAMLGTILEAAQSGDTGGYASRWGRYGGGPEDNTSEAGASAEGWNDLIGWIEEQGEDDTQGFRVRFR